MKIVFFSSILLWGWSCRRCGRAGRGWRPQASDLRWFCASAQGEASWRSGWSRFRDGLRSSPRGPVFAPCWFSHYFRLYLQIILTLSTWFNGCRQCLFWRHPTVKGK